MDVFVCDQHLEKARQASVHRACKEEYVQDGGIDTAAHFLKVLQARECACDKSLWPLNTLSQLRRQPKYN
jgi:hypothetical protein